ncbi:hypothetical protein [Bradyrhizobium brasilense]
MPLAFAATCDVKPRFSRAQRQDRASLYDEFTDKIIVELQAGRVP